MRQRDREREMTGMRALRGREQDRQVQFVRAYEKRSGKVQERKGLIVRVNKMKDRGKLVIKELEKRQ